MKHKMLIVLSLTIFAGMAKASLKASAQNSNPRIEINLNNDWKFMKGDFKNAYRAEFNDSSWENVCLPHTWNSLDGQDGGDDYYRGPGWYRKKISIPDDYSGRKVL